MNEPDPILRRSRKAGRLGIAAAVLVLSPLSCLRAAPLAEWRYQQDVQVAERGLVRLSLPAETLNAARPGLEDLRLQDPDGNPVPFLIDRPRPAPRTTRATDSFASTLDAQSTTILIHTGVDVPIAGVVLRTPAREFIKAVKVEGQADGGDWRELVEGVPLFRQAGGSAGLQVEFPAGVWNRLRLTVDDSRSSPVPFTGAMLVVAPDTEVPSEAVEVRVTSRDEAPNETRLTLDLGSANLTLARLEVVADAPLFTRAVTVLATRLGEEGASEETLSRGTLFRFGGNGQPEVVGRTLAIEQQVPTREVVLRVDNGDSPPLSIRAVRAWRRPVYVVFHASEPGRHELFVGHPLCPRPRYDVASLADRLKLSDEPGVRATVGRLVENPAYSVPEALPGLLPVGAPLDVTPWKHRRPVRVETSGVQILELDLQVLAHAQRNLGDLRLMHGSNQVPFLIEHTSLKRAVKPTVSLEADAKRPNVSRWALQLPLKNLPLERLICGSSTPLFERRLRLVEEIVDRAGTRRTRELGSASWSRAPGGMRRTLELTLSRAPRSDTLFLETDNGDNPPIQLEDVRLYHPVSRLVFKADATDDLLLYYGNTRAVKPSYDLRLVGRQLLAAPRQQATLGEQEDLQAAAWTEGPPLTGVRGVLFWGVLGLVVVALFVVMARLLPKPTSSDAS